MKMDNIVIGEGNLAGKGLYAARDFKQGEVVKYYNIKTILHREYAALSESEKMFTHERNGVIYLYLEPDRYTNHSDTPNTIQDFEKKCDIATQDIKKGDAITTDATREDF